MGKLETFEIWLRETGAPEDVAMFSKSVVQGILAVAGKGAVTFEHVELAAQLARDAGVVDVAAIERLGALLVHFETGGNATETPVSPMSPMVPMLDEIPPEPAPAAVSISFKRPTTGILAILDDEAAASAPPVVAPKPKRPVAAIAIAIVAVGAVGAWWLTRGGGDAEPAAAKEVVVLDQTMPEGWRVVHAVGRATLLAHGADQMWLATLPASQVTDVVAVARTAETGASSELVRGAAHYYSEGCAVAGERIAVCRGTAVMPGGDVVALQTYVRVGEKRALLALVRAPASSETAAIVGGFTL